MRAQLAKKILNQLVAVLGVLGLLVGCSDSSSAVKEVDDLQSPATIEAFPFSHDPARVLAQGPLACAECHAEIFEDWQKSHHAKANRPISAALDASAFTPTRRIEESGVTYELAFADERFELRVLDAAYEVERVYELTGVIGYTPLASISCSASRRTFANDQRDL
jgi:hypothetical protein